jgi:hypothetical protein
LLIFDNGKIFPEFQQERVKIMFTIDPSLTIAEATRLMAQYYEYQKTGRTEKASSPDTVSLGNHNMDTSLEQDMLGATAALPKNASFENTLVSAMNLADPAAAFASGIFSNAADWPVTGGMTTADGLRVDATAKHSRDGSVSASVTVTRTNGQTISFEAGDNVRINEREDGSLAVTFAGTGETRVYAADGGVTTEQGEPRDSLGTDGNDVLLQFRTDSEINAGAGDDAVLVLARNYTVNGGDGDDLIVLGNDFSLMSGNIYGGSGNDTLRGGAVFGSADMGDGDNTITIGSLHGGSLTLGNGDNTVNARSINQSSTVALGNGDNTLISWSISEKSAVMLGDGDNTVRWGTLSRGASLAVGNGDNTLMGNRIWDADTRLSAGDGNNRLVLAETTLPGNSGLYDGIPGITMGNGNNTFIFGSWALADISTGAGQTTIVGNVRSDSRVQSEAGGAVSRINSSHDREAIVQVAAELRENNRLLTEWQRRIWPI